MTTDPIDTALREAREAYDAVPDHRPGSISRKTIKVRKDLNAARLAYVDASLEEIDDLLEPPCTETIERMWRI